MKALSAFLIAQAWLLLPLSAQTPEWIWFKKTDAAETRYFRKTFTLDGAATAAELVTTADDGFDAFINGEPVLSGSEWSKPSRIDVKARLKPGTNVVALRAFNGDSSPAGALLQLTVTTAAGRTVVVTDSNWKAAERDAAGWNRPGFDDAAWARATSLGKIGVDPWGNVLAAPGSGPGAQAKREATAADLLYAPSGFKIELLHSADFEEGSWVNLCKDDKGRLIISPQYRAANPDAGLLRVTLGNDGRIAKREFIARPLYDAQGMVFAHGALWVVVNKYSTRFESGLYRITDDGSDKWDRIELVKKLPGGGEHGPHAVELGPDGNLWVMAGNHTKPPEGLAPTSPHKNYQEDQLLPRQPDGNGHATGVMAPGGYILRGNRDGTRFDLFCAGFRNQYDFAFNVDGEIFVYDADMEWDWGMPWYRPTRVNHAVSGAEFGWRFGTGKWPDYYPDSLGAVVDIGIGCPTGVSNAKGARFPARYQRAIYVMDWTYGRLMAVHLQPEGAGYKATWENFVCPAGLMDRSKPKPPLNVTDLVIGDDGAMYFVIGGRGTASGLYRVTYAGPESTAPAWQPNMEGAEARELRHRIEAFHGQPNPAALAFIWPHLSSPDRALRYAARIALEAQPVPTWRLRAIEERSVDGGLTSLLALARVGDRSNLDEGLRALGKWPLASLTERQQLDKLRVMQVAIARHGLPSQDVTRLLTEEVSAAFPNPAGLVNREAVQVLVALGAPDVVGKALGIMAAAKSQEEIMHYLFHLRTARQWTLDQRREYLSYWTRDRKSWGHQGDTVKWFEDAGRPYGDGASFNNFLKNFLKEAASNMSAAEQAQFGQLVADIAGGTAKAAGTISDFPKPSQRQFVKEWTTAELVGDLDKVRPGRNFERGRQAFVDAQCLACHRFGIEGGGVGPDLTSLNTRFKRLDILESMLEPSKVVSEQYQHTTVTLKGGDDATGRLVDETVDRIVLVPNPLEPDNRVTLKKSDVTGRHFSKVSPMPEGLLNQLSKDEILDLLAFIESGGRRDHAFFKR